MNFLFGIRFSVFDMICYGIVVFLINDSDNNYWYLLILVPTMYVSVVMERKLAIQKILNEVQRGYSK